MKTKRKKPGPRPMREADKRTYISVMVTQEARAWVDSHPEGRKVVERLIVAAMARAECAALADAGK